MKTVMDIGIGGMKFTIEETAYMRLRSYLARFERSISGDEAREVMEDVELRIAEVFHKSQNFPNQVVSDALVDQVINQLGDVEPTADNSHTQYEAGKMPPPSFENSKDGYALGEKRLHRDMDRKMMVGVCSGLAAYFDVDPTLVRIVFAILFFAYGSALIAYIVLWIVMPKAITISQKLQMKGYATTVDNIRRYSLDHNQ